MPLTGPPCAFHVGSTALVKTHLSLSHYRHNPMESLQQLSSLPNVVWLDSGRPGANTPASRYDIISAAPSQQVRGDMPEYQKVMQDKLDSQATDSHLPFSSGWIGYIGYESRHDQFGLPDANKPLWFGWYDWALIHDHELKCAHLVFAESCCPQTKQTVEALMANPLATCPDHLGAFSCSEFTAKLSRCAYIESVERIQDYIQAGDCYQVNFTQCFNATFSGDALSAYNTLRQAIPSPYCSYLALEDEHILSISPERFIKIDGKNAVTQPIKGTAPRDKDPDVDNGLKSELQNSTKNRAENVMIVDLLRNDFSQLCVPHSVKVPELFKVHSFENVHHLVSTVAGELQNGVDHIDFILACFPGGSITGAPKKRAMQIINELEPTPRGPYCGSIGYFSSNKKSEFNIAIRTLHLRKEKITCWGGGGIVADSNPDAEYDESLYKIRALMHALSHHQI